MKIKLLTIFIVGVAGLFSGCSNERSYNADMVWTTFVNQKGNSPSNWANVHNTEFRKGTVLPSSMDSSVSMRLPAYYACYDTISISPFGAGDSPMTLCIYLVVNPVTDSFKIMHRGRAYLADIAIEMASDEWTPDVKS